MASRPTPAAPSPAARMSREVMVEYYKLTSRQKQQEVEFDADMNARIQYAKGQLFERHAYEQSQFWKHHEDRKQSVLVSSRYGLDPGQTTLTSHLQPTNAQTGNPVSQTYSSRIANVLKLKPAAPGHQQRQPGNVPASSKPQTTPSTNTVQKPQRIETHGLPGPVSQPKQSTINFLRSTNKDPSSSLVQQLPNSGIRADQPEGQRPYGPPNTPTKVANGTRPTSTLNTQPQENSQPKYDGAPKKTEIIDLCGDDGPKPGSKTPLPSNSTTSVRSSFSPSIPSASVSFFGSSGKTFMPVKDELKVKGEDELDSQKLLKSFGARTEANTARPPLSLCNSVSPPLIGKTSTKKEIQSKASEKHTSVTVDQRSTLSPNRRKKPIPLDLRPEISQEVLWDQQKDRSCILKSPMPLPRDPNLLILQQHQQGGGFVRNILNNDRSQNWASGLGKVFERPDGDITMTDAPTTEKPQCPSALPRSRSNDASKASVAVRKPEGFNSSLSSSSHAVITPNREMDVEASSQVGPQPLTPISQESTAPQPSTDAPQAEQFKKPSLPAQAMTGVLNTMPKTDEKKRTGGKTVYSQASMHTMTGSNKATSEATSATSKTTQPTSIGTQSHIYLNRKRKKQISVSSEDESEFEPTPPPTSLAKRASAAKKAKATSEASVPKPVKKAQKYGFKPIAATKANRPVTPPPETSKARPTPSTPGAPRKKNTATTTPLTPKTPTTQSAAAKSRSTPRSSPRGQPYLSISSNILPWTSERRAKTQARNKIHEDAQDTKKFRSEEDIRRADEQEAAAAPTTDTLPHRLRSMSITPVPGTTPAPKTPSKSSGKGRAYTGAEWMRNRFNGDRYLAKSMAGTEREESEDELDLSGYKVSPNGAIVWKGIEEMDMSEEGSEDLDAVGS